MMALRADWRKNLSSRKQFLDVGDSVELVVVYAELLMNRWSDGAETPPAAPFTTTTALWS